MDSLIAAGRRFGMIFIDHWHGYDATREAALRAEQLISPGGFVLFHDYTDGHSADPSHPNKVYLSVRDTIAQSKNSVLADLRQDGRVRAGHVGRTVKPCA